MKNNKNLLYLLMGIAAVAWFGKVMLVFPSSATQTAPAETVLVNYADEIAPHYVTYSEAALSRSLTQGKVILYFYAPWCSTCSILDDELKEQGSQLPSDVMILKVDYDTEKELRKKYSVVMQHTLIQIDTHGNEVTRWIGGNIETIKEQLR